MTGLRSRTTSPSRSTTNRKTPCVAGWWGPIFTVITSVDVGAVSGGPAGGGFASVLGPPKPAPGAPVDTLIPAASAIVALVVREGHWLSPDGEVPALRPADVVVGKQDPPQVGVAAEDDSEEVESLPLLELGSRKQLTARVDFRKRFFRGWRCRGDHPRGR